MGAYTQKIEHMKLLINEAEYAGVLLNNSPAFRVDNMPYGGIKDSGFGREGLKYAIDEMTENKLIIFLGNNNLIEIETKFLTFAPPMKYT